MTEHADESQELTKHCISCHEDGHTYLECPNVDFGNALCGLFGVPNLATGESAQEAHDRAVTELEEAGH